MLVRFDQTGHWPVWVERKGRCKYPNCSGIVKVQCSKCATYLCFSVERNCFLNFHKQWGAISEEGDFVCMCLCTCRSLCVYVHACKDKVHIRIRLLWFLMFYLETTLIVMFWNDNLMIWWFGNICVPRWYNVAWEQQLDMKCYFLLNMKCVIH